MTDLRELFTGIGPDGLWTVLELLDAEKEALVRVGPDCQVLAMTPLAGRILDVTLMSPLEGVFSPRNSVRLHRCVKGHIADSFPDRFDNIDYMVSVLPNGEGALVRLRAERQQSLLEAMISVETSDNLNSILYEARRMSDELERLCLLGSGEPGNARKAYQSMQRKALRIKRLLRHAEWLEQSEMDGAKPVFRECDLAKLCRDTAAAFAAVGGAVPKLELPEHLMAVFDPEWMKCALLNLLTNARHAEHIRISAAHRDYCFLLTVADDGEGLLGRADLQELYNGWSEPADLDRQYRGSGPQPGTGLPLVKRIAQAHGGNVFCGAAEPHGTIFRISFPDNLLSELPSLSSRLHAEEGYSVEQIELSVL